MPVFRFDAATLPRTPWKNGGGSTREIVCRPSGVADFDWRVSLATIAADGPFSRFDGVDRVIVLLSGGGVLLQGDGSAHRLDQLLQPHAFAGETPLHATLLGAVSEDFNVMCRRAALRPTVRVLRSATDLPATARGLLYAARGRWQVGGVLEAGQGLWWEDGGAAMRAEPLAAGAALLAVGFEEVSA